MNFEFADRSCGIGKRNAEDSVPYRNPSVSFADSSPARGAFGVRGEGRGNFEFCILNFAFKGRVCYNKITEKGGVFMVKVLFVCHGKI